MPDHGGPFLMLDKSDTNPQSKNLYGGQSVDVWISRFGMPLRNTSDQEIKPDRRNPHQNYSAPYFS